MIYQIDGLNISYEYNGGYGTINTWIDSFTAARKGLIQETMEYFGSYMGDDKQDIKQLSYYTVPIGSETTLPSEAPDDISYGLFRYVDSLSSFGNSSQGWQKAVREVANWYTHNVKTYSQTTMTMCSLTGMQVRWDCSGFVTACLQRYGLLRDVKWPPSSRSYANDPSLGRALENGGFEKLLFSWDTVQPFDIIVYNGHIEIYNGRINGKHTSWAWGAYHPTLPCGTAHVSAGYDYIWRCKGGGNGILFNKTIGTVMPGESGLSDFMFKYLYQVEAGIEFGKPMPNKLLVGVDLGDHKGHRTFGAGLAFHPNGRQYMDAIKSKWTQQELDSLFTQTAKQKVATVKKWASSHRVTLNQNQIDCIVSCIYNFGEKFLNKQVCQIIARNPNDPAIYNIWAHMSDRQGAKYPGLIKRRKMEADHYIGRV